MIIKRSIMFNDITGGINNVDTKDRLNSTPKATESPDMVNVEYFELGGIKSMEGNTQVGDKQTSKIVGGYEYRSGNRNYMMVATYNGNIKIYNAVTDEFDTIYTFSHQSDRVSFCNMNGGVVVSNGKDDLLFYQKGRHTLLQGNVSITEGSDVVTGTQTQFTYQLHKGDRITIGENNYWVDSVTSDTSLKLVSDALETLSDQSYYLSELSLCNATLTNSEDENVSTPVRGLAIQYYKGRLWVGGDSGLFYSGVGLYDGWDITDNDAGVLYNIYNDSSSIKALGLYGSYMMVHKEFSTYILTISDEATTIDVQPYTNISCDSQQSWVVSNTKYYVYSSEHMGIFPIGQRTIFNDKYIGEEVTKKVRNIFKRIRQQDTDEIFATHLPNKRWILFYLPLSDNAGSGNCLIFDFQTKSWLYRRLPSSQVVTIVFTYNNQVYVGTEDGRILLEFTGSTFNGEAIQSYYKSPWFDWANGYSHSFAEFTMELASDYTNNFYIRSFKDGGSKYEDRIIDSENLLGEGLVWDGTTDIPTNFTYWNEDDWVTSDFQHLRMVLPNNVFDSFQLEIGTNTLGQGFAIYGYGFRRIETEEAPW